MDRNNLGFGVPGHGKGVALRKESVDRNCSDWAETLFRYVALRKESVDRNPGSHLVRDAQNGSLSARRAWIEMPAAGQLGAIGAVALRKESVDRNTSCPKVGSIIRASLSARRAWIEMPAASRPG